MIWRTAPLSILGLSAPVVAASPDLLQCLADPAKTKAVFAERYPHETCVIGESCDPKLVQSAATLAKQRCRLEAVETCAGKVDCQEALRAHWESEALSLRSEIETRLNAADLSRFSMLAQRRFADPQVLSMDRGCPSDIGGQELSCPVAKALADLTRMEKLDAYLAAQEARE